MSSATNLVTNAIPAGYHLYVRDLRASLTTLVDSDTNGVGSAIGPEVAPSMSADGRYVAFHAGDGSLVPNDRNQDSDVFVRDLTTGTTEMISARHPALPSLTPNGLTTFGAASISGDGRYIAFVSDADNLVSNDTNKCQDVLARDLVSGTNWLVSTATNGFSGDGLSFDAAISCDGRFVAFTSLADNLVAGDTNKAFDVFLRDLGSQTTVLVSQNSTSTGPGNGDSSSPVVGADGRCVLFRSSATNLAAGSFANENLYWRDTQAGTNFALTTGGVSLATMTPDGRFVLYNLLAGSTLYVWDSQTAQRIYTNTSSYTTASAMSADGRVIAFRGLADLRVADLTTKITRVIDSRTARYPTLRLNGDGRLLACTRVPSTSGGTTQIYLYSTQTGSNTLVSQSCIMPGPANAASDSPDISPDGHYVVYRSAATDIVPGDTNGMPDVFLYDVQRGTNLLLVAGKAGSPNNRCLRPFFSSDGRTLLLQSWASDLAPQDFNHNSDLFAFTFLSAVILPATPPDQSPWLSWPFVSGKSFRVQCRDDLANGDWHDLTGSVTNSGNTAWFQDSSPDTGRRFYRILAY
jgi:Tol biopolymer transport system component